MGNPGGFSQSICPSCRECYGHLCNFIHVPREGSEEALQEIGAQYVTRKTKYCQGKNHGKRYFSEIDSYIVTECPNYAPEKAVKNVEAAGR